jgi:alpha-beta hydrolase superfamily lysophospholipase
MKNEDIRVGYVWNKSDGNPYQAYHWKSQSLPYALVFFFHGLGSYAGNYFLNKAAHQFVQQNYHVHAYDQHGHGRSSFSTTGDLSILHDHTLLVPDALLFMNEILTQYQENIPFFLMGESMGGALSILSSLEIKKDRKFGVFGGFRGAVLLAPAIESMLRPSNTIWNVLNFLNFFKLGKLRVGPASTGTAWKKYDPEKTLYEWEFRNKEAEERSRNDPLTDYPGRLRITTVCNIIKFMDRVKNSLEEIDFPFICFHSYSDCVTPFTGAKKLIEMAPSSDKELVELQDSCHSLISDPEWNNIYTKILNFLENRR